MRTHIRYNPRNRGTRILHGPAIPGARQIVMGPDNATKQARKTKKGAADILRADDDKGFLSPPQRERLLERAGKAYGTQSRSDKPFNPFAIQSGETAEEFVVRINRHIAAQAAK